MINKFEINSKLKTLADANAESFHKEELVFWESNTQRGISLSKKENISNLVRSLIAKNLRQGTEGKVVKNTKNPKVKLKVVFADELNGELVNFDESFVEESVNCFFDIFASYANTIEEIEFVNYLNKVRLIYKFQAEVDQKRLDKDFTKIRDNYNSLSKVAGVGQLKCYRSKTDNWIYADIEKSTPKEKQNKRYESPMEKQYEV